MRPAAESTNDPMHQPLKKDSSRLLAQNCPGAYTVRYHFVICGFSLAETELISLACRSLVRRRLLGRAPEAEGSEPF